MGLMTGKRGVVFGVANDSSLAWHIAEKLYAEGAEIAFNHLPGDKMERRVRRLAEPIGAKVIAPCDVSSDDDIERFFSLVGEKFDKIDFLVHSIAYANRAALVNRFWETGRDDFKQAMDISVYSLIAVCQKAFEMFNPDASVLTLSYLGAVRYVPGYNVMGLCKAALESSVRYLAADLGDLRRVRVNAISAGPVRTLSSAAIARFDRVMEHYPHKSPLRRNITAEEVGKAGLFLCSDLASGITGEVQYVDAGYNTVGW
jgi:enoyl-[acyl-carrier protein] reductase I